MPTLGDEILVVTGLPRSGTSMVMRMLAAGGVPLVTDAARPADAFNPHGYFEYDAVKRTRADASWVERARGRAVKVVAPLPCELPAALACRVVLIERDLGGVMASQRRMIARNAAAAGAADEPGLAAALAAALAHTRRWIAAGGDRAALELRYEEVVRDPGAAARALAAFVGGGLDVAAMAGAVEARAPSGRARGSAAGSSSR